MRVCATRILPMPPCAPGNGGIVPPWLHNPPVIGLPVEPPDDAELPVEPMQKEVCDD